MNTLLRLSLLIILTLATANAQLSPQAMSASKPQPAAKAVAPRSATHGIQTIYSHGNPTNEEQLMLEYINRARNNPTEEGIRLATTTDPVIIQMYNYYKINPADIQAAFATYPKRPPLAFNEKLIAAARRHTLDMITHEFFSHTGSDGSTFDVRINDAGYKGWTNAGENISYAGTVWTMHQMFNIDFGVASLGHRENIMNFKSTKYHREIGIGIMDQPDPSKSPGPKVTTEDFGFIPKDWFLLGVVYNDVNNNGFYDIGEGIPGVSITLDAGSWSAVTSSSGGYAVPIAGLSGTLTITASGGPFATPAVTTVALTGENVKVDFAANVAWPGSIGGMTPGRGAVVGSDSVRLSWNIPDNTDESTEYEIIVATDSSFTNIVLSDTLRDTSLVAGQLGNSLTYYWKVRAKNKAGWGPWSTAGSFTVAILPAKVALEAPADGSALPSDGTTLQWRKVAPGGVVYWLEVSTSPTFVTTVLRDTNASDTMRIMSKLQNAVRYYWRVKARNIGGWGAFSDTWTFTPMVLPGTIRLISPADNGVVSTTGIPCIWSAANPTATKYRFELASDPMMTTIVRVDSAATDTMLTVSNLQHDNVYYWRVTPGNAAGWGTPTAVNSFTVRMLPNAVQLLEPAANASPNAGMRTFTWQAATPGVTKYQFELYNSAGATLVVMDSSLTALEKTVTLDVTTSYWWHVRAKNSAGWGPWSEARNLSTTAVGVAPLTDNGFALDQNTPNPFNASTTFHFTLYQGVPVTLTIINALGQTVATVTDGFLPAGNHAIAWTAPEGLSGSFFYRLTAGLHTEVRRLIIR